MLETWKIYRNGVRLGRCNIQFAETMDYGQLTTNSVAGCCQLPVSQLAESPANWKQRNDVIVQ
ncbi:MAG: hypothetical protein DME26_04080 [Verrucomicrobia bacterium]|nr:MAG: hypothetical protein DME26_04080 [Verrucomicrobiota bacterium]